MSTRSAREAELILANRFVAFQRQALYLVPVNTLLLAVLLSPVARRTGLLAWIASGLCLTLVRARLVEQAGSRSSAEEIEARAIRAAGIGGLHWGGLVWWAAPSTAVGLMLAVTVVVIGAMGSAATAESVLRRPALAFQTTTAGLLVAGLARAGGELPVRLMFTVAIALACFLALGSVVRRAAERDARAEADLALERRRLARSNVALRHQAEHDHLTGLANRSRFEIALADAAGARRSSSEQVAVLFIDLDRFKFINDSYGHEAGDLLLAAIAGRIERQLPAGAIAARIGGDELTVLLPRVGSSGEAVTVAEAIMSVTDNPFRLGDRLVEASLSIGVALLDPDADDPEQVLREADDALYRAKQGGRARIETFDPDLRGKKQARTIEIAEVRCAVQDGSLVAWYQPIVDVGTGAMVAAEGLARRTLADGSLQPAGGFLDLVVEGGLLPELTDRMADRVASLHEQLALSRGARPQLAVNVAPDLVLAVLRGPWRERDLAGLIVEIPERSVARTPDQARDVLDELHTRGAQVHLDDFGSGASSLALLTDLPFDGVKIDRRIVAEMPESAGARAVAVATAEAARLLGMTVTAEGVESREQLDAVAEIGVDRVQGFLFSSAVPEDTLVAWLDQAPPWAVTPFGPR